MLRDALMEVVSSCGETIADDPEEDADDFDAYEDEDGTTYMNGANDLTDDEDF